MLTLVRIALLLVIAGFLIGGVVVGLGMDTGPFEKVVLVAFGALLVAAAVKVNKIGTPSAG
jgi:hypothetical protein